MFKMAINRTGALAFVFLLITSFSFARAQQSSAVDTQGNLARLRSGNLTSAEPPLSASAILARFVEAETKGREALNQHTFKRDVVLQTIGRHGQVTGEYIRNSQFLFDDSGSRIERVVYHPPSGIREMRITKEDIQDLAGAQLLGIDIVEATKYQLTYAGMETVDSRQLYAIDVSPSIKPDPKRMKERFFVGRVWVDPNSFQILKIKGVVEPQGKQRFPLFETWRQPVNGEFAFPTRTEADDILRFPESDVHYRIKVKYYDYKLFASKVTITDVEDSSVTSLDPTPKSKSADTETCVTNRNSPPVSPYHWPADAAIKVYLVRNMFTAEQRIGLMEALKAWTVAGNDANAGISFTYAGESDGLVNCRGCLTIRRREVYKNDGSHYSFFNPLSSEEGRVLLSAWIDLDVATTSPRAVRGFMAHELGHGMGLWDCETCKKKRTIMNGFPGINTDNGLIGPSKCDLEALKGVYVQERQIAAAARLDQKNGSGAIVQTNFALASNLPSGPASPRNDRQHRPEDTSLFWWDVFLKF
jgi:hypothetical protein